MNTTSSESYSNNLDNLPSAPRSAGASAFLVTSLVSLLLGMFMLAGRPTFLLTPSLTGHGLAWLELLIFGCAYSGLFGIAYDALPRTFDVKIFSEQMIFLHLGFHIAGFLLVIVGLFADGFRQAQMGPTFLACGAIIFAINIGGTFKAMKRPDAAAAFLSATVLWLLISAFLGVPFAAEPPFAMFATKGWNAGWMVLALAGVVANGSMGIALRVTPPALGLPPANSASPWYAFVFINAGLAWLFAGVSLAPMPFVIFCAAIYLLGSFIYIASLLGILQSRTSHLLVWDARILLTAACMLPVVIGFLMFAAWERMNIPPVDPALAAAAPIVEETAAGPLPMEFLPVDGAVILTMILAVCVPALIGLMFQLVRIEVGLPANEEETSFRGRLGNQILLASFFNYAVGVLMVIPAAWVGIERILSLGTLFLLVGAAGFLGNFFYLKSRSTKEQVLHGQMAIKS